MGNEPHTRRQAYRPARQYQRPPARSTGGGVADYGVIGPAAFIIGIIAVAGFWPAMAWHGTTDTGGWRWDIHSTIGCLIWWGVIIFLLGLAVYANREVKPAGPPPQPDRWRENPAYRQAPPVPVPPPAPARGHLRAVKVDSVPDPALIWCCWCPDCEAELPAGFRRACCGTGPETPHLWNCPHAERKMAP